MMSLAEIQLGEGEGSSLQKATERVILVAKGLCNSHTGHEGGSNITIAAIAVTRIPGSGTQTQKRRYELQRSAKAHA
jgi:hypothetical protein